MTEAFLNTKSSHQKMIEELIGPVQIEQLRHVDCFVGPNVGMFMPVSGPCSFAITSVHSHPTYFFALPFNDQVSFKIDNQVIITEPKKLIALSPQIQHKEIYSEYFPRYVAIFINKSFFEDQLQEYSLPSEILFNGDLIPEPPGFIHMIKEFMLEADNQIPGASSVLYAISLRISHSIIRSMLNLIHLNDKISFRLEIDQTIQYMHLNLDKKITIENLAKIAHMSPSHYSRLFKNETGQSCISYLNQIRMDQVKRLLREGDKSITEIAHDCGFGSSAYLSASFYKQFKLSPSEYQNLLNKDDISKVKD